jgi:hypothetical protein
MCVSSAESSLPCFRKSALNPQPFTHNTQTSTSNPKPCAGASFRASRLTRTLCFHPCLPYLHCSVTHAHKGALKRTLASISGGRLSDQKRLANGRQATARGRDRPVSAPRVFTFRNSSKTSPVSSYLRAIRSRAVHKAIAQGSR